MQHDFYVTGDTSRVKFQALIPETIPNKQKVLDIKYSQKPTRVYSSGGDRFAEFVFRKPAKHFTVTIDVTAELYRYDLITAKKNVKDTPTQQDHLENYLVSEKYIEKDHPAIQKIAAEISGTNDLEMVENIYEYVLDNMKYSGYADKDRGAIDAAKNKKGDCTEYTDLFVALCRASNIPARCVEGFTSEFEDTPRHAWAEVYPKEYGWVPFDPAKGDVEHKGLRKRRFKYLETAYVYLSSVRNKGFLDDYHYCGYWYHGDKIKMKDKVTFKTAQQKKARR